MDKRSRAYKIYCAGKAEYGDTPGESGARRDGLIAAIAVMVDYATKKPKPKEKKKLLYTEQDVLRVLNFDLEVARHGQLNARLAKLTLHDDDLEKFEAWFRDSMYPWMASVEDFQFTYSMLCRKYGEWLERARQWTGSTSAVEAENAWR